MEEKIVVKKVSELEPGYILKENVGNFKGLQEGSILNNDKINLLKSINIEEVAILELVDKKNKTKAVQQEIEDRLSRIFDKREYGLEEEKEEKLSPKDFLPKDRTKATEILSHVKQSDDDILQIENGEKISLKTINHNITTIIKDLEQILKQILVSKEVDIKKLEATASELIDQTGPKRDSSFLLLGIIRKDTHLIIQHAVNTCLISLAIAIEMSKLMKLQLNKTEVMGDFKKLQICNNKIFDKEELIKLAIAGILHDISLVDAFPNINKDTVFTIKDQSKIELHPSMAYTFLTQRNLDFDIRKAILQHHERADGSGYPDGIEARNFTKYARVLSFANDYDLKTTKNPFEKKLHPQKALLEILQKERKKFDDDVIFAFCKSASLYPIGSWVVLSDDTIGLVVRSNKNNLRKPIVKAIYSSDFKELKNKKFINIEKSHLEIKNIIDVESLEIFDKRYERFIFDEREFQRIVVALQTEIKIPNTNVVVNGIIENISAGGLLIRSGFNMSKGNHVTTTFIFKGKELKDLLGIITWKKEEEDVFFYGVRFLYLDDAIHHYIYESVLDSI